MDAAEERLVTAPFVHLIPAPTVDALAATAILVRMLEHLETPYHVTRRREPVPTDEFGLAIGMRRDDVSLALPPAEATVQAAAIGRTIGAPAPSQWVPVGTTFTPKEPPATEQPRVLGLPKPDDPAMLAASTLVHGPFSGDELAADHLFTETSNGRDRATLVALATLQGGRPTPNLADGIIQLASARATPDGPFATTTGTADVLDVLADADPGLAVALVCGYESSIGTAITTWRDQAAAIHAVVDQPSIKDEVIDISTDTKAVSAIARLLRTMHGGDRAIVVRGRDDVAIATPNPTDRRLATSFEDFDQPVVDHGDGRITIHDWPASAEPRDYLPGGRA